MVILNKKGWTLVELMIVAAIVGVIASVTPSIINQTTKFFILGKTKLDLQEQARAAMYLITRELHEAQSASIVIDSVAGQPYYSRIKFTTIQGKTFTCYQSSTNLMLVVNNDTTILTKNLAYLGFTFPRSDDMTIVSVSMTLQEQIYQGAFKALHMASERVQVMD
jgi:prepilin-type N-terminal cleavage/methylation domain-containing protein